MCYVIFFFISWICLKGYAAILISYIIANSSPNIFTLETLDFSFERAFQTFQAFQNNNVFLI